MRKSIGSNRPRPRYNGAREDCHKRTGELLVRKAKIVYSAVRTVERRAQMTLEEFADQINRHISLMRFANTNLPWCCEFERSYVRNSVNRLGNDYKYYGWGKTEVEAMENYALSIRGKWLMFGKTVAKKVPDDLVGTLKESANIGIHIESISQSVQADDIKKPATAPQAELASQPEQVNKFGILADLGIITVPEDYVHATRLTSFVEKYREFLADYDIDITDANFAKSSRILKPCDKLHVRAFKQILKGKTTSNERMKFLDTQRAVYPGAQGLTLVFEQMRDLLPKCFNYFSFDKLEALCIDEDDDHKMPYLRCHSDGDFELELGIFEAKWIELDCFLCFNELSTEIIK